MSNQQITKATCANCGLQTFCVIKAGIPFCWDCEAILENDVTGELLALDREMQSWAQGD